MTSSTHKQPQPHTQPQTQRRASILREMGLAPLWKLRHPALLDARVTSSTPAAVDSAAEPLNATHRAEASTAMANEVATEVADELASTAARAAAIATMNWQVLRASVAECRACALCQERKQPVPGVGDESAGWLFVGEAPGAEEDVRGEPFVGQAGKLLDAMLAAIGLQRGQDVYITNAVKCHPPGNRPPHPEEMAACRPYLERQIALLQPRLMMAMGRVAAQTLLQDDVDVVDLAAVRGRLLKAQEVPLVVTYHPAYLIRKPDEKAKAWEDLCLARRTWRG